MNLLKRAIILIVTVFPLLAVRAQLKPEIDLIAGTVNGRTIAELTTDQVTDFFGRPSATTLAELRPDRQGGHYGVGSTVVYSNLGLIFRFSHPRTDPQQRAECLLIYLSGQKAEGTGIVMTPFSGMISRGINGNWKTKRVIDAFADFAPTDAYDPKKAEEIRAREKSYKALGMRDNTKLLISILATINMNTPQVRVVFNYDDQTKFLERLQVLPNRSGADPQPKLEPVGEDHGGKTIMGSTKAQVAQILKDWSPRESNRTTANESICYYTKDVSIIVHYRNDQAVGVAVVDRPSAGVTSISQTRYEELVKLIGEIPKPSQIKRDSSSIREFSVGDTN